MEVCGILPVIKPVGPTSHDIVDWVRRLYNTRQVGHTGTLDPAAEGLLLVCLGTATKVTRFLTALDKTYRAVIKLGVQTTTGDREGEYLKNEKTETFSPAEINSVLSGFAGSIEQRVPDYSAVKVKGRRLYAYARSGDQVPQIVRRVEIYQLDLVDYTHPELTINVRCGGGTYLRSLAEDIGAKLGCGGYLAELSRTGIGPFSLAEAEKLDDLEKCATAEERLDRLRSIEEFLPFPAVFISDDRIRHVQDGRPIPWGEIVRHNGGFKQGEQILICDRSRRALAVGTADCNSSDLDRLAETPWFHYERVLLSQQK